MHLNYEAIIERALLGVVREVLITTMAEGLKDDHHFYITFDTTCEDVEIPPKLKAEYPTEMTIVLQHQFEELSVDQGDISHANISVVLRFNGVPCRLKVPFVAIKSFADPYAQFGLVFKVEHLRHRKTEDAASSDVKPEGGKKTGKSKKKSDNVVKLDAFRKKK